MSSNVTLHAGHDVAYFTHGQHRGGCAGAMSYYTAAGEPPGEWAGKGAATLGLADMVDPDVIERLYQENIGPGGELLVKRRRAKKAQERGAAAVAAYLAAHPYASATELAEVRAAARGKDPHQVPYFDMTVSAVKSVSVLHASYRVAARQARSRGDQDRAAALDARADAIEAALMDSAREAVAWLERHATYTRTGHHSARTGEWRDGDGLAASIFLHHLSRDGDPQLHVHVAIWNRVQRADGADDKWRTLDSRSLHQDDMLVLDEASQLATADLAMIQEAARQAGARVIATGDTAQLGAVEAGGMFRLLAREVPAAQLHEVRRFDAAWEREASIRLRDGDLAAVAAYDRHGRIRGADHEAAYDRAAAMWLADHLRGKDVLLLAGSNAEAADLSRRVQAKLTQIGSIGPPQTALADGNHAGIGDLIRARLNTKIDAGGRALTNRDTLAITAFRGPDAEVRRQRPDGTWTGTFLVPRSYLARHAELVYAGNVHVAQGRTVDTAHLLVADSLSRQALYVGMTRGRVSNTAHVVTGKTAPPGHAAYQQATAESVLADAMQRDAEDLSATEQIRKAQEWSGGTGHLLTLWSAAVRQTLHPQIDERIKAALTEPEAWRYEREHSRKALEQRLRAAQLAGHEIGALIDHITAAPMDRARSISSVLYGRLQQLALPRLAGHDVTWAQRTPAGAPAVARELAAALDDRARALGERTAASPEPWLARQLGVLAPGASPALCAEYTRRAGIAAAYREAAGITNPDQAVSPEPHRGNPELETMRNTVFTALEISDEADILRGLDRGELEARFLAGERAQAAAPPDVSATLRLTAQAEADALRQSADAQAQHDETGAASATALAVQLAAERQQLEAGNAQYEQWAAGTHGTRETAGKARAELQRRGQANPEGEPQAQPDNEPPTTAGWWRAFEADLQAVERAIARQHQAAIDAGQPWPPSAHPNRIPSPRRRRARRIRPRLRSPCNGAGRRGWTSC